MKYKFEKQPWNPFPLHSLSARKKYGLSACAMSVLIYLAARSNHTGWTCVGHARISDDLGRSKDFVTKGLQELYAKGVVTVTRRARKGKLADSRVITKDILPEKHRVSSPEQRDQTVSNPDFDDISSPEEQELNEVSSPDFPVSSPEQQGETLQKNNLTEIEKNNLQEVVGSQAGRQEIPSATTKTILTEDELMEWGLILRESRAFKALQDNLGWRLNVEYIEAFAAIAASEPYTWEDKLLWLVTRSESWQERVESIPALIRQWKQMSIPFNVWYTKAMKKPNADPTEITSWMASLLPKTILPVKPRCQGRTQKANDDSHPCFNDALYADTLCKQHRDESNEAYRVEMEKRENTPCKICRKKACRKHVFESMEIEEESILPESMREEFPDLSAKKFEMEIEEV
jgi:hypothetical protein